MFLLFWCFPALLNTGLQVEFSNIVDRKGSLYIAVYDRSDAFLRTDQARVTKIIPLTQTGTLKISLDNLPAGQYALSCFHDVNGNGELDTNMFGVPTEPYGFSNNARPKLRAPNWAETNFKHEGGAALLKIRLEKW